MRQLKDYIYEGRKADQISIKDQNNKLVNVAYYCYDAESLNDICDKYKNVGKYWINKGFFIAKLKNKSTWIVDTSKEFKLNTYRPNGEFLEFEDESYTYKELVDLLEAGETMLIIINK